MICKDPCIAIVQCILSHHSSTLLCNIGTLNIFFLSYYAVLCSVAKFQVTATPWTVACQASLSMGFSRREYWSMLLFPFHGIFLTHRLNSCFLHWQANSLTLRHWGSPLLKYSISLFKASYDSQDTKTMLMTFSSNLLKIPHFTLGSCIIKYIWILTC